jgi:murein hydrolase activator
MIRVLGAASAILLCWLTAAAAAPPASTTTAPPAKREPAAPAPSPVASAPSPAAPAPPKAAAAPANREPAAAAKTASASKKQAPRAGGPIDEQIAQLESLRQQCIAATHSLQEREKALGAIDLAVSVMHTGVEQKDKEIADSRKQQERLLAALERLARAPPEALALAPKGPVDRLRSGILIAAAVPALAAQARQMTGELASLNTVRKQIDTSRGHVEEVRAALEEGRTALAQLVRQRNAAEAKLLHENAKWESSKVAEAPDAHDLIKRADAAIEQHDKELPGRLRKAYGAAAKGAPADPAKPKAERSFDKPDAQLAAPVQGEIAHHARETDDHGKPRLGITWTAMPKAVVVAPFDGRVVYAGPFRDYGLVLIIGHGGDYHSLLAGLGRADVTAGQWVLAGEPVASLAERADKDGAATLYMELRRGGYPVDPEPRLANSGEKTEETRVRR